MRLGFFIFLFIGLLAYSFGQDTLAMAEGVITFKSSVNYYVKFSSTEFIRIGDTLFSSKDSLLPSLVVHAISSTSCVGKDIMNHPLILGDKLWAKFKLSKVNSLPVTNNGFNTIMMEPDSAMQSPVKPMTKKKVKSIQGRIMMSSYSSVSNFNHKVSHRMRYTFLMNGKSINGSKWSGESYFSFRHKLGDWGEVKNNLFGALKIYSLALKFDLGVHDQIWIGRKINLNVSNLGAVDGLQYERKVKKMTYGAILGSRPDYNDYNFNFHLMQMGIYGSHSISSNSGGDMSSTLGLFEQRNGAKTDRRFMYFQHSNALIKDLMVFSSIEIDLFKMNHEVPSNTFTPTSIYLSLRYKLSKKWVLTSSYDALKNVIYYESYKSYIDQIIEKEARQGLRFGLYYDPWKKVSIGLNTGYRFQADKKDPSKNADVNLSFYDIGGSGIWASLSGTYLDTDYLKGNLAGLRLNKSFNQDKWSLESSYRIVQYKYTNNEIPLNQNIISLGINCRLMKKLSLSINGETTTDVNSKFSTVYCNLMRRF